MRKLFAILAVFALGTGVLACDFGEEDDATTYEDDAVVDNEIDDEVIEKSGPCVAGESDGLFFVRIADDLDNATLTGNCGDGNPGADIDGIVLKQPDGSEYFAATVEEDTDVAGGVCTAQKNDKDDINTVLGQPDGCAQEIGCGCGDYGFDENADCDCTGGDKKWLGYYSMNGGAIIVSFDEGAELLCGSTVFVYEMYNKDDPGTVESFSVSYGDENGNWRDQSDWASGVADVDVTWEW